MLAAAGLFGWLAWAAWQPVPLGTPVDLAVTPADVKPEWYFLALYQLLQIVPERIGVLIPGAVATVLIALPFIHPAADGRQHRLLQLLTVLGLVGYGLLTLLGYAAVPTP